MAFWNRKKNETEAAPTAQRANALLERARALEEKNKRPQAKKAYEDALAVYDALPEGEGTPKDRMYHAFCCACLAGMTTEAEAAETLYSRGLEIAKAAEAEDESLAIAPIHFTEYARLLLGQKDLEKVFPLLKEGLESRKKAAERGAVGVTIESTADYCEEVIEVLQDFVAVTALRKWLELLLPIREAFAEKEPTSARRRDVISVLVRLGGVCFQLEDAEGTDSYYSRALEMFDELIDMENHPLDKAAKSRLMERIARQQEPEL